MTAQIKIKDTDLGFKKIVAELKTLGTKEVLIGIQEGSKTKTIVKGGRKSKSGEDIAIYAAKNEFGTDTIPQRSFMRSAFDENIDFINAVIQNQYSKIVDGRNTVKQSLDLIGRTVEGLVKQKIRSIYLPPNSQATIKAKGSSKPLIDFGNMINSVRYNVKR